MEQNLYVFDFELTDEEIAQIRGLDAGKLGTVDTGLDELANLEREVTINLAELQASA